MTAPDARTGVEGEVERFVLPASFGQRRLWFLHQLDPASSAAYVDHGALRLRGDLDLDAARRALATLVDRHETLRTCLDVRDGEPVQIVTASLRVPLETAELDGRDLADAVREIARRPLDLTEPPLFRVVLIRVAPREHVLVAAFHHSVYDQWSAGVFLREFLTCYAAHARGAAPELPELPIQYGDYAAWQRESADDERTAEHIRYWTERLAGLPPLGLPTDRPRPRLQTFDGATCSDHLDARLVGRLEEIARAENATPFMALLAGFAAVLSFYSGQEDVAVGSPIAGRDLPEVQDLIGFFVNNLVLRTDLSGRPGFAELVRRVRRTCLDAYAHQDVPFDRLVEELRPARDLSRSPLFQVMFVFGNVPLTAARGTGLDVEMLRVDPGTAKLDLFLMLLPREDGIEVTLEYNTGLFDETTVTAMLRHYRGLLESAAGAPDRPLTPAAMMTEDNERLIERCGTGPRPAEDRRGLACLVSAQAAQTPARVAVADDDTELTYAELETRANRLAHRLRALGVGRGDVVAVCLDRHAGLVVTLLAVLRAGAAYLPLDPGFPAGRVAFMLGDSGARALVTERRLLDRLPPFDGVVTDWELSPDGHPSSAPEPVSGPEDLAYLIYTSGSTGRPKGVMVPGRALVNLLRSMAVRPGLTSDDALAAVTTVSFDIAALELFLPLIVGARIEMVGRDVAADGSLLAHRLASCEVTVMQATPTTWRLLLDAGWRPDGPFTALCGGEALPPDLARSLTGAGATVWNMYGPTETTVWSACCRLTGTEQPVPLGAPIDATEIHVLDAARRPVPPGVPGEIYIGGAGLALGYHDRPELTAERFVPDPRDPRRRLYRTGDAARLRADGRLEFLGRLDDQVKLRGYRIEPGEIAAVLREHPEVREAAVTVHGRTPGDRRLAAYVESPAEPPLPELWELLRSGLPGYMLPSSITVLARLPRTPNNKVDVRALPEPDAGAMPRTAEFKLPSTESERRIAAVWAEVLGWERVGVDDDFFEGGGNSLLAARIVAALRQRLGVEIPVRAVFDHPTVAGLARIADGAPEQAAELDVRADVRLAPDIRPGPSGPATGDGPVLVTGGSGFLGGFVLASLLAETDADTACVVRAPDAVAGLEKIAANLRSLGVWDESWRTRIRAVPGDLGRPLLGLDPGAFARLGEELSAIYHVGASVNLMLPYPALRATNVTGTQEVLRLAVTGPTTPVHHVSTVSVFPLEPGGGPPRAEFELPADPPPPDIGYSQSKWVAEGVVRMARERGVPVAVYRPGHITGDTVNGVWRTDDLICRVIRSFVVSGTAPDVDLRSDMHVVDALAKTIVRLSRTPGSLGRNFHFPTPRPVSIRQFVDVLNTVGYAVRCVPTAEWYERCRERFEDLYSGTEVEMFRRRMEQHARGIREPVLDAVNAGRLLGGDAMLPQVDEAMSRLYIERLIGTGFLPAPDAPLADVTDAPPDRDN